MTSLAQTLEQRLEEAHNTRFDRAQAVVKEALGDAAAREMREAVIDVGDDAGLCDKDVWTAENLKTPGIGYHYDEKTHKVYVAFGKEPVIPQEAWYCTIA